MNLYYWISNNMAETIVGQTTLEGNDVIVKKYEEEDAADYRIDAKGSIVASLLDQYTPVFPVLFQHDNENFTLATQLVGDETLETWLKRQTRPLTNRIIQSITFQLLWALYIGESEYGFTHHDIKHDNIRVSMFNGTPTQQRFRLGKDVFQIEYQVGDPVVYLIDFDQVFYGKDFKNQSQLGALEHIAPEAMLNYKNRSDPLKAKAKWSASPKKREEVSDVFSLGLVLLSLIGHRNYDNYIFRDVGNRNAITLTPHLLFYDSKEIENLAKTADVSKLRVPWLGDANLPEGWLDREEVVRLLLAYKKTINDISQGQQIPIDDFSNKTLAKFIADAPLSQSSGLRNAILKTMGKYGPSFMTKMLAWSPQERRANGISGTNYGIMGLLFHPYFTSTDMYLGKNPNIRVDYVYNDYATVFSQSDKALPVEKLETLYDFQGVMTLFLPQLNNCENTLQTVKELEKDLDIGDYAKNVTTINDCLVLLNRVYNLLRFSQIEDLQKNSRNNKFFLPTANLQNVEIVDSQSERYDDSTFYIFRSWARLARYYYLTQQEVDQLESVARDLYVISLKMQQIIRHDFPNLKSLPVIIEEEEEDIVETESDLEQAKAVVAITKADLAVAQEKLEKAEDAFEADPTPVNATELLEDAEAASTLEETVQKTETVVEKLEDIAKDERAELQAAKYDNPIFSKCIEVAKSYLVKREKKLKNSHQDAKTMVADLKTCQDVIRPYYEMLPQSEELKAFASSIGIYALDDAAYWSEVTLTNSQAEIFDEMEQPPVYIRFPNKGGWIAPEIIVQYFTGILLAIKHLIEPEISLQTLIEETKYLEAQAVTSDAYLDDVQKLIPGAFGFEVLVPKEDVNETEEEEEKEEEEETETETEEVQSEWKFIPSKAANLSSTRPGMPTTYAKTLLFQPEADVDGYITLLRYIRNSLLNGSVSAADQQNGVPFITEGQWKILAPAAQALGIYSPSKNAYLSAENLASQVEFVSPDKYQNDLLMLKNYITTQRQQNPSVFYWPVDVAKNSDYAKVYRNGFVDFLKAMRFLLDEKYPTKIEQRTIEERTTKAKQLVSKIITNINGIEDLEFKIEYYVTKMKDNTISSKEMEIATKLLDQQYDEIMSNSELDSELLETYLTRKISGEMKKLDRRTVNSRRNLKNWANLAQMMSIIEKGDFPDGRLIVLKEGILSKWK